MEVGRFSCGSVFGLGEQMEERAIVARTTVQCMLIPRYWLFQKQQNLGNIWQRYVQKNYLFSLMNHWIVFFFCLNLELKCIWIHRFQVEKKFLKTLKIQTNGKHLKKKLLMKLLEEIQHQI